jgi:hypothetical protein
MLKLVIHSQGAEPYPITNYPEDLEDAIAAEAHTIAADAGSDLLDDPGEDARAALAQRIIDQASLFLTKAGDSYTDPTGTRWSLVEASL